MTRFYNPANTGQHAKASCSSEGQVSCSTGPGYADAAARSGDGDDSGGGSATARNAQDWITTAAAAASGQKSCQHKGKKTQ